MRISILLQATLFSLFTRTAIADGATIVKALDKVDSKTISLKSTVQSWSGDILGSLPILTKSASLLIAINDGKDAADDSDPLTTDEALSIASAVSALATDVNTTMAVIIDAHDQFEHLLLAPVVLLDLKAQKAASDDMSNAIVAKVPTPLQGIAQNLVAPIDAAFNLAIDAYSISNGI